MIKVGVYELCGTNAELFLDPSGLGGRSEPCPNAKDRPRVVIGGAHKEWWRILDVLIHEVFEYAMTLYGFAFSPVTSVNGGSDVRTFVMTHSEFTRVNEDAAYFVAKCQNDLCRAWKAAKKGRV